MTKLAVKSHNPTKLMRQKFYVGLIHKTIVWFVLAKLEGVKLAGTDW